MVRKFQETFVYFPGEIYRLPYIWPLKVDQWLGRLEFSFQVIPSDDLLGNPSGNQQKLQMPLQGGPLQMVQNTWVSLGLFHPEIRGVYFTLPIFSWFSRADHVPCSKLTWQCKITTFNRRYILKLLVFVTGFPGSTLLDPLKRPIELRDSPTLRAFRKQESDLPSYEAACSSCVWVYRWCWEICLCFRF